MRTLIVGRTHMGARACVGGLSLDDGRSVRLFDRYEGTYPARNDYRVGEVWELDISTPASVRAPHVEDVIVTGGWLVGVDDQPGRTVLETVEPWRCRLLETFEGLLKVSNRHAYLGPGRRVPDRSTWFWVADERLGLAGEDRYESDQAPWLSIKYVGLDDAPAEIEPDQLVRLSLAGWYQGDYLPEERCYLQVSGVLAR